MLTTVIAPTIVAWGDFGWFWRFHPSNEFYVLVWVTGALFVGVWALWDWAHSPSPEDKEAYYQRAREWERHLREDGTDD